MKTIAILVLVASSAHASQIEYIHKGFGGNGTLNGIAFTNADFTITSTANVADRQSVISGYLIENTSTVINIAGIGDIKLLTATQTFLNTNLGLVGFGRSNSGSDLFNGPDNAALASWDLVSDIGPIFGTGRLLQWASNPNIETDHGILFFENQEGNGNFRAVMVPAPAAGGVLVIGAGLAMRRRRLV